MADELVTVELNGHQFQVKVPKGSDDDYVNKAATDYHAARYPNEAGVSKLNLLIYLKIHKFVERC